MTFTENWFSQKSCDALAGLVADAAELSGRIVEIGSWEGRSTVALANGTLEPVHAVDTWQGSPDEISAVLAAQRDVKATFDRNIAELTRGNVIAHQMGWRQYLAEDRSPIKLLFIDGEHTYLEVRDTIETALPMMVPGGIICGDDNHHPPVQRAVLDALGNADLTATLWVHRVRP